MYFIFRQLIITILIWGLPLIFCSSQVFGEIEQPVLKWQYGGCYSSWCETGWYSSVAVADLDGDGTQEVIGSAYSIVVLDGEDGELQWRVNSGHDQSNSDGDNVGRTWPGIVVTDLENDGDLEIVSAHGGGYLSVYDHSGYFKSGWPKRPVNNELRGLVVDDLDNDGSDELVVSGAVSGKTNTWVYEHNGSLRAGWPQLENDSGYAYGVFNDNSWIADIDGDGSKDVIVPSDVHYICAYSASGQQLATNSMYGDKGWGKIGLWEDPDIELRGWGDCSSSRAERYRTNLAHGAATAADLDGDGSIEVIVTGNMYDCANGHPPGLYTPLYIFNGDRSRFIKDNWDWSRPAMDTGAPLSEDYNVIESCQPNPVVVDLDGDGRKEVLFSSYDGRLHGFWLDKTEHYNWPASIYKASEGFYRFSSEPVVADLDNDGKAEIIFVSWVQKQSSGTMRLGKLHILDYQGNSLYELNLPPPRSSSRTTNGALAAPTLANIDADSDLEVVVNTIAAGFVAYDIPGSSRARVLWNSGRNKKFIEELGRVSVVPFLHLLLKD